MRRRGEKSGEENWIIFIIGGTLCVTNALLTHACTHLLPFMLGSFFLFNQCTAMSQRWTFFLMMSFSKRDALIRRFNDSTFTQSVTCANTHTQHTHITSHFGEPFFLLIFFRFGISSFILQNAHRTYDTQTHIMWMWMWCEAPLWHAILKVHHGL